MIDTLKYKNQFREQINSVISGKGNILLIEGEQGFGKSHLIKEFAKICNEENNKILNIIIENEDDSSSESSQTFKPLLPISKALEAILKAKNISAKKKLAVDMTLTSLSMIPIFGDFIYGVKELSKDWKSYKREQKESERSKGKTGEYLNAFKAKALEEPYVLFFEDMHSADAASERFLQILSKEIAELPIFIVIAYNPARVAVKGDVMYALKEEYQHKILELLPASSEEVSKLCEKYIDNYTSNKEFSDWFLRVSSGIPAEIIEFLEYFKTNKPFNSDGELIIDLSDSKLSSNAGIAFKEQMNKLTADQLELLLCASCIGRDFSVSLLSELVAKSPIYVTKIIREINQLNNYIRSLGAFKNLGVKSTVYRFNENTFYRYLREMLEFEEIFELNARISEILKLRLNSSNDEEVKEEIANKLLRHSKENDDEQNISLALNQIKDYAESTNDIELKEILSSEIDDQSNKEVKSEVDGSATIANEQISFMGLRNLLTNNFNNSSFEKVIELSGSYLETEKTNLSKLQFAIVSLLQARANMELGNHDKAKNIINSVEKSLPEIESDNLECLFLNTKAILHFNQGHYKRSITLLQKSSELALNLPNELRIITLANIAKVLKQKNDPDAEVYYNTAKRLQEEFDFSGLIN
ncbi:AAA family ATPase [Candidatus Kapabacteria bacterium]|nr:AAA family ATPase [Candidatus Kapabacteria bacterium]